MATTVPVESLPEVPSSAEGEPPGDQEKTPMTVVPPPKLGLELEDEPWYSPDRWLNKGSVSNAITFVIMIIFIILKVNNDSNLAIDYGLAFGLFGFAGGITNWLAVKMLFDRVPLLIGSGVIPRHFKAISRASTEKFIDMFFEEERLRSYIAANQDSLMSAIDIPRLIRDTVEKPDFDATLLTAMTDLSAKPEGAMLQIVAQMMGGIEGMVPQIKPMLVSFAVNMADKFGNVDISEKIPVDKVRSVVEDFLEAGLSQLTPEVVKQMMEKVIREHLGWLVVWGNVFGGLIGVVCLAAGLELGQPTCPA